ncbi:MAG: hypothetical protein D6732_02830, partial [Methanobacteriota archaeon]
MAEDEKDKIKKDIESIYEVLCDSYEWLKYSNLAFVRYSFISHTSESCGRVGKEFNWLKEEYGGEAYLDVFDQAIKEFSFSTTLAKSGHDKILIFHKKEEIDSSDRNNQVKWFHVDDTEDIEDRIVKLVADLSNSDNYDHEKIIKTFDVSINHPLTEGIRSIFIVPMPVTLLGKTYITGVFSINLEAKAANVDETHVTEALGTVRRIFSSLFIEKAAYELAEDRRRHAENAARAAIMGRNFSHNVGSHALANPNLYKSIGLENVGFETAKLRLQTFNHYMQERLDFLARAMSGGRDRPEPLFFINDV